MANLLDQSYTWCYRVARDSGSSFYRAFWLLDRQQRLAMFALYAFARITDDLGDGSHSEPIATTLPSSADSRAKESHATERQASEISAGQSSVEYKLGRLAWWSRMLADRLETSVTHFPHSDSIATATDPESHKRIAHELARYEQLWPALRDTVMRYGVPPSLLQELIGGVAMDAGSVRMQDWDEVEDYSYRVAATVGLACLRIWQAADTLSPQQAIDCGVAFQLTNILRDVREDARRDRIYIPSSELERFGCDSSSWLAGQPQGDWPGLVEHVIARTRGLYESGRQTMDHLPPKGKRIFHLMWSSYRQLLEAIAAQKSQLWSPDRISLSRMQRTRLLIGALLWSPKTTKRRP